MGGFLHNFLSRLDPAWAENKQFGMQQQQLDLQKQQEFRRQQGADSAFAEHMQQLGALHALNGMVKRDDTALLPGTGQPFQFQRIDKADPSRLAKWKTAEGDTLQFELPTYHQQLLNAWSAQAPIRTGEAEQEGKVAESRALGAGRGQIGTLKAQREELGFPVTPEEAQLYGLPGGSIGQKLAPSERANLAGMAKTRAEAQRVQAQASEEQRKAAAQHLSGLVDPSTGQVEPQAYQLWRQQYPEMNAPPAPVNSYISQAITSAVPIEKQPEYLVQRNLYSMKPAEFASRVDALGLPPELSGRTKELVGQALQLGDRKGALAVIKDASDQMGRTETAVRTAEATKPIKIDIAGAMAGARAPKVGDEGLDMMAENALAGQPPSSRNPVLYARVMQRAAELAKSRGLDAQATVMESHAAKANTLALQSVTRQYETLKPFADMAEKNAAVLEQKSNDVLNLGAPVLNTPVRQLASKFAGNTKVTAFQAALLPVQADFARILNSPTGSGQLTDNARKEMEGAISPAATPAQIKAALDVFRTDARNRRESYEAQLKDLKGRTVVTGAAGSGKTEDLSKVPTDELFKRLGVK